MPTLGELKAQFSKDEGPAHQEKVASASINSGAGAAGAGSTKTSSERGGVMANRSLQDLYIEVAGMDKTASAAAGAPATVADGGEGGNFAELAAKLAEAEVANADGAGGGAAGGGGGEEKTAEEQEFIKQAAEFDAAGRFMARGFFDEFLKLAGAMDTSVAPNQRTESESKAQTPALGPKGLVTVETNFAGAENHDQGIDTKGGKDVYKDSLAPAKSVKAGVTGDDPEAAAISAGSGSPAGFATIRDLMG